MLTIGNKHFDSRLIQAPLAGISCAPFRVLAHTHGNPAYCTTEMLSAAKLCELKSNAKRYIWRDPREKTLAMQLSGNNAKILAHAVSVAEQLGADLIDLNCGCPMPKIRKKNAGTKLLEMPQQLIEILTAMRQATSLPLTVKMRIINHCPEDNIQLAQLIEACGIDGIVIHGRTWQEDYTINPDFNTIAQIKKAIRIPIIGNGNVGDKLSLQQMLATGCDGIMIGRAGIGQPWIFHQLHTACDTWLPPQQTEIDKLFQQHIHELAQCDGEKLAILQARRLAKWYRRQSDYRKDPIYHALTHCETLVQFDRILALAFESSGFCHCEA